MVAFPFSVVPLKRDSQLELILSRHLPSLALLAAGTVPGYSHSPLSRLELEFCNQSLWLNHTFYLEP